MGRLVHVTSLEVRPRPAPRAEPRPPRSRRFDAAVVVPTVCLAITLWVAWIVVVPFLRNPSETRGDAAGHFALALAFRDSLWPALRGFQPDFFLGFMLGEFYPPLFHYVVATLGKWLPIVAVFRGVLALAMLVTPLAVYRFARALGLPAQRAVWFVVAATAILFTSPDLAQAQRLPGGTFHSTSVIGLVANGFALPLWFEALGAVARALRGPSVIRVVVASVWSAAVVLSHFVCGVAAVAFAGALVVMYSRAHATRVIACASAIAVGTFVLSAFFVVPFFFDRSVSPLATIPAGHVPLTYVLTLLAGISLTSRRVRNRRGASAALVFVLGVVSAQWIGTQVGFAAHLDRFHPFVQLAALLAIACALPRRLPLAITGAAVGAGLIALSMAHAREFAEWEAPGEWSIPPLESSARTLIVGDAMQLPGPHWISNSWPASTRSASALGLFVESSPVAPYLFQLSRVLVPAALSWGVDVGPDFEPFQERLLRAPLDETSKRLRGALRRLGIDHLVTEQTLPFDVLERESEESPTSVVAARRTGTFALYSLAVGSTNSRASLVRGPLVAFDSAASESYRRLAREWLFASDDAEPLPVVATQSIVPVDPSAALGAQVRCEIVDERRPLWRLSIDAPRPVPVLLALGYHPRLRATCDGVEVPVLRGGPGLTLVIGRGAIEVDLGDRPVEAICDALSSLGWSLVLAVLLVRATGNCSQVRVRFVPKDSVRTSD